MKRLVLAFGVIGFVGCFLPMVGELSWFDMRHFDEGWTVWLVIAAFATPALVGLSRTPFKTADAAGATAAFAYIVWKFHGHLWDLIVHSAIGGMLMGLAAVLGFVVSGTTLLQTIQTKKRA
ncbi:MAG TPA: hypothetical protein VGF94_05530 [Kofleriaceae bacterium]|jgi:hypothetical protein